MTVSSHERKNASLEVPRQKRLLKRTRASQNIHSDDLGEKKSQHELCVVPDTRHQIQQHQHDSASWRGPDGDGEKGETYYQQPGEEKFFNIMERTFVGRYGRIHLPIPFDDFLHGEEESSAVTSLRDRRVLASVLKHLASWSVFSALLFKTAYRMHNVGKGEYGTMGWTLAHVLFILDKARLAMHDDGDGHAIPIDELSILAALYISDQWVCSRVRSQVFKSYLAYHPAIEHVVKGYNAMVEQARMRSSGNGDKQPLEMKQEDRINSEKENKTSVCARVSDASDEKEMSGTFESLVPRLVQQQIQLLQRAEFSIHASIDDLQPWKDLLDASGYFWYFENYTMSTARDVRRKRT
ncbi:hypothetical protein PSENEW3_00002817 [Picochlorum sp. SENEW3]|nr:hypothetical protein PSENEW3_00002817 [Picochlorum sp. SENEW3]